MAEPAGPAAATPSVIPAAPPVDAAARGGRRLLILGFLLSALLGAKAAFIVSGKMPLFDSGIYLSEAFMMKHGALLYSGVFDQKPPVIHLIDLLAVTLSPSGVPAVWLLECLAAGLGAGLMFLLLALATRSRVATVAGVLVFVHLASSPATLEGGNLTEEYANPLLIACALSGLLAIRRASFPWAAACGALSWLTVMCKEPFLFSVMPLVVMSVYASERRLLIDPRRTAGALLGLTLCMATTFALMAWSGILRPWFAILDYNTSYSTGISHLTWFEKWTAALHLWIQLLFSPCRILFLLVPLGVLGLFARASAQNPHLRQDRATTAFMVLFLVGSCFGPSLSGFGYGHYFMQVIPATAVVAALGVVVASDWAARLPGALSRIGQRRALALLAGLALLANLPAYGRSAINLVSPGSWRLPPTPLLAEITARVGPQERLWAPLGPTWIYSIVQRRSAARYLAIAPGYTFIDSRLRTAEQRIGDLMDDLRATPPALIILPTLDDLNQLPTPVRDWIIAHYVVSRPRPSATCPPCIRSAIRPFAASWSRIPRRDLTPRRTPGRHKRGQARRPGGAAPGNSGTAPERCTRPGR